MSEAVYFNRVISKKSVKMSSTLLSLILGLVLVAGAFAQVPRTGPCPNPPVQRNFQLRNYLGKWYEYQRFFAVFEITAPSCVSANYSLKPDGHVRVLNQGYNKLLDYRNSAEGDAVASDPNEPAKLGVRFSENQPYGPYWVLDTDYNSYTLIYSCTNGLRNWFHFEIVWILTRNRGQLSAAAKTRLYRKMRRYGLNPDSFYTTDQSDCPI